MMAIGAGYAGMKILSINFRNSTKPQKLDFVQEAYLTKGTTTYAGIMSVEADPIGSSLQHSFALNTQPSFLGKCNRYKDTQCKAGYLLEPEGVIRFSFLLGDLVDRDRQGYPMTEENWNWQTKDIGTEF